MDKVKQQITSAGHSVKVVLIKADLANEEDCVLVVNKTVEALGKLDVLVNSAGILTKGTTENTTLKAYDELMNINLRSPFYLLQLSIPHLRKTKGSVVNVSSVTGLRAVRLLSYNSKLKTKNSFIILVSRSARIQSEQSWSGSVDKNGSA